MSEQAHMFLAAATIAAIMASLCIATVKRALDASDAQLKTARKLDAALAGRLERIAKDPLLVEAEAEVERFLSGEKQG